MLDIAPASRKRKETEQQSTSCLENDLADCYPESLLNGSHLVASSVQDSGDSEEISEVPHDSVTPAQSACKGDTVAASASRKWSSRMSISKSQEDLDICLLSHSHVDEGDAHTDVHVDNRSRTTNLRNMSRVHSSNLLTAAPVSGKWNTRLSVSLEDLRRPKSPLESLLNAMHMKIKRHGKKTAVPSRSHLSPTQTPGEDGNVGVLRRRNQTKGSPQRVSTRERPKSECLTLQLADSLRLVPRRPKLNMRERPKSDLGSPQAVSNALEDYEMRERMDCVTALPDLKNKATGVKPRRFSTPHPIKMRQQDHSPPVKVRHSWRPGLYRSRSAPELLYPHRGFNKKSYRGVFQGSVAGDLHIFGYSSDENISEDGISIGTSSDETGSVGSHDRHTILEEIFEEAPSFVEALWDHVTMDPEELGFRAGDLIEVTDMSDKHWWWGKIDELEGWFPASFVRLRAIQMVTADDLAQRIKDGAMDSTAALRCYNTNIVSKEQARANVVKEIVQAEREYVRHLRDVVQGYVEKARKRPEMFTEDQLSTIFSNIEQIYAFSSKFVCDLEKCFNPEVPQATEIGHVFLKHRNGFEMYSAYCNDHPQACESLHNLKLDTKYQYFFEACRLLQQMIEIPLEGFLIIPVQKICKYPLQLGELLKYTREDHPDYERLSLAHSTMKQIAMMINERKRKMESIEKLSQWQATLEDWEGPDLLETSSEVIYSGELAKVNASGWSQDRMFFMLDHQLVYCKKDLLWRDILTYKGRIDLDNCDIVPIKDGKDMQFNTTVKNAWKIHDHSKEKWYLLCAKSPTSRDRWLRAFVQERQTVQLDKANGFSLAEYREKAVKSQRLQVVNHPQKAAPKTKTRKVKLDDEAYYMDPKVIPSHATLPRSLHHHSLGSSIYQHIPAHQKAKRTWLPFKSRKPKS